ncbi:MAG: NosD domain-containing protein [Planctomycetota bacterium]
MPASGRLDLPVVELTEAGTTLTASCEVRIPLGLVLAPEGGPALRIEGDDLQIRFAAGSVLRGSAPGTAPESMIGTGLQAEGCRNLSLEGLVVEGFKVGIRLNRCDGAMVSGSEVREVYRQRLYSTVEQEDKRDWLYPHHNDGGEWLSQWGAAIAVADSKRVTIARNRVRTGQNGIVLERVEQASVFDNDASFLSGWGLAMWRSSHNRIHHNAFDFCVRGHSEGVYNRGQDSAGILMFEQCNRNSVVANSCTHGGDGYFGFAGREALGEAGPERKAEEFAGLGNSYNLFLDNDFSYAVAHGLEQTFSSRNRIFGNRFVENGICGIWGGYSNDFEIADNRFDGNGALGYGLERGAINIEHGSGHRIMGNQFAGNACGVHLWVDDDGHLLSLPWMAANHRGSRDNAVFRNSFKNEAVVLRLRDTEPAAFFGNHVTGTEQPFALSGDARVDEGPRELPEAAIPEFAVLGQSQPVGARAALAGRGNILMGTYGPWDHVAPMARLIRSQGREHVYEVRGVAEEPVALLAARGLELGDPQRVADTWQVRVGGSAGAVQPYLLTLSAGDWRETFQGVLSSIDWQIRFFPSTEDWRGSNDVFAAGSQVEAAAWSTSNLDLRFGMGGPARVVGAAAGSDGVWTRVDHFALTAEGRVTLPAGWLDLHVLGDDGIRVKVNGAAIDNWSRHGTMIDTFDASTEETTEVHIRVAYFELDGAANLRVELLPR